MWLEAWSGRSVGSLTFRARAGDRSVRLCSLVAVRVVATWLRGRSDGLALRRGLRAGPHLRSKGVGDLRQEEASFFHQLRELRVKVWDPIGLASSLWALWV